jgi:hypothetical protein
LQAIAVLQCGWRAWDELEPVPSFSVDDSPVAGEQIGDGDLPVLGDGEGCVCA